MPRLPRVTPVGVPVGEVMRIIAINRKTGYVGTRKIRLEETLLYERDNPSAYILLLRPPNIKVIATRTYQDEAGLTKDKQHNNQLIGSEGAGLTSDQYIKIQTVWLAHDGSPLPEDLPGYTGRIAISTGSSTRDFSDNFEIKPGYQTQLIQLNNAADLNTEHFYVQVVGENSDGNPTFESPGAGPGKLQTRPKKYVPIKVPIFNELATYEAQKALIKAKQDGVQGLPDEVDPVYQWYYRPEMQFSVYDFRTQQLQLTHDEGSVHLIDLTQETELDVLSLLLADDVDFVELLYDLLDPDNDQLPGFGPERQLILSIGAEEVLADITPGGVVRFENPQHINLLSSEDLTTISLYQNNDSFNTLWKYSFYAIRAKVDNNRDGVISLLPEDEAIEAAKGDDATRILPFRFWVNNDYDVVNDSGSVNTDVTECPPTIGDQVCEQWDETETNEQYF